MESKTALRKYKHLDVGSKEFQDTEEYKQIDNDLEMLDIAKELLKACIVSFDNNNSSMRIFLNKETAEKVRKWLNGK